MDGYRAYFIGPDGRITTGIDLYCDDDASAIENAKQLVGGYDGELWQRDRMIARFRGKALQ